MARINRKANLHAPPTFYSNGKGAYNPGTTTSAVNKKAKYLRDLQKRAMMATSTIFTVRERKQQVKTKRSNIRNSGTLKEIFWVYEFDR